MNGPFDDHDGSYLALVNGEGQHSLWPAAIPVPDGWSVAYGPADRASCLDSVERSWTGPRPGGSRPRGSTTTRAGSPA
ncbi:MbtH family protein [Streptomyces sp. NBC_00335]|uniref:MbtH family protein n=1 Tax=unclassified Streptomyces TaxID=2593676 RepID=UPI0022555713|nr:MULTISPECIES: MbtH family protein [unclassified Streptomyces]MCX5403581.1 MbtH family protein [Streptomyces sp. NBC_00086]